MQRTFGGSFILKFESCFEADSGRCRHLISIISRIGIAKLVFANCRARLQLLNGTSRDRPKSAPYPRLKNSKTTSKCQVLFYSTRKSKFFEKKFFEKITYSKKMDRVARRGSLARAPGALKSHNAEKLKGRTL